MIPDDTAAAALARPPNSRRDIERWAVFSGMLRSLLEITNPANLTANTQKIANRRPESLARTGAPAK
jgi:hypothetical protein